MRKSYLAAAAVLTLAGATALAQNDTKTTNPPATTATPTPNMSGPAADNAKVQPAPMPGKGPNFITLQNDDMLSSNVVGLDIYNDQNSDIGKIQDIAFDSSKKVAGYILSVGGFLGMGTRYVAVDPDAVKVTYDTSNKVWRATMNATKDQLKSAPEFKYGGQWNASRS
jgi:sporulation protein YlmC with PRC-barrel domain